MCVMFFALAVLNGPGPMPQELPDRPTLVRALDLAHQSPPALENLHAQYELDPGGSVQSLEITTPFRRAVLEVQGRTARGEPLPTMDELQAAIAPYTNQLTIRAIVELDPHHAYVRPPDHSIELICNEVRVLPAAVARTARGPGGVEIPPAALGGGVSMSSLDIEAHFPAVPAHQRHCCRAAVIDAEGNTLLIRAIPATLL